MLFIGTVFASSWGPIAFMSIWSKTITADAAFWGIVTGFVFNVVPSALVYLEVIDLPSYLDPAVIGAGVGIMTIIVVSKLSKVTRQEAVYRMRLHRTPRVDYDLKKVKITLFAPALLIVYGCVMPVLLIVFYVIPYQTGTGQLLADGSVDWFTGEAILALSTVLVFVPLGLLSARLIWYRYSPTANVKHSPVRHSGTEIGYITE
jgi:sodium/pantothenate symporter